MPHIDTNLILCIFAVVVPQIRKSRATQKHIKRGTSMLVIPVRKANLNSPANRYPYKSRLDGPVLLYLHEAECIPSGS